MVRTSLLVIALAACGTPPSPVPATTGKSDPVKPAIVAVDLAEVTGWEAHEPSGTLVAATRDAITLDGANVLALHEGVPDAADTEYGGMRIPKLVAAVGALGKRSEFGILIDRTTTYRLLLQLMYSTKLGTPGLTRFAVYATANGRTVMMPIDLPDQPTVKILTQPPAGPTSIFLAIDRANALVFSSDGSEGSLGRPKMSIARADHAALGAALAEIRARRGGDITNTLAMLVERSTDMQTMANIFGAVKPGFDVVQLSVAFDDGVE